MASASPALSSARRLVSAGPRTDRLMTGVGRLWAVCYLRCEPPRGEAPGVMPSNHWSRDWIEPSRRTARTVS